MHCVTIATGDIHSLNQVTEFVTLKICMYNQPSFLKVYELGYCGYDGIILGRRIIEVWSVGKLLMLREHNYFSYQLPDIKGFIQSVHNFRGLPRIAGMGMKSSSYVIDNMDKVLTEL